jgi:hypothetical protein
MLFVAVCLVLYGGAFASATSYYYTNLPNPYSASHSAAYTAYPLGISDGGLIAGNASNTSVVYQGTTWQVSASGTLLAMTVLGGQGTYVSVGAAGTTIAYDSQNLNQETITTPGSSVPNASPGGAFSVISLASGTATDYTGNSSGVTYYSPNSETGLWACNASGQVAGAYTNAASNNGAAIYGVSSGMPYQLQLVSNTAAYSSTAYAVDNAGTLVGGYSTNTATDLATWYINGSGAVTENDLAMPSGGGTRIFNNFTNGWVAMSANGQYIVATGYNAGKEVADVWTLNSNGTVASSAALPMLATSAGDKYAWALGVSNNGVVVGEAENNSGTQVAVEWTYNGSTWSVTQLSTLVSGTTPVGSGNALEAATAITSNGQQICGEMTTSNGSGATVGFLLTNTVPLPEPSTVALTAAGLVGLLAYAWRKRK